MRADWAGYAGYIARALNTSGGHLSIGRGGFELQYEHGHLSGYDCDRIEGEAIAAGLPVIDSRNAPFDPVAQLVVKDPMIAVNKPPSPRRGHGVSYVTLPHVAAAYRAIGAEIYNIKPTTRETSIPLTSATGTLGYLRDSWLTHFLQYGL